ncbi:TetR/AcrR family transcriptional regulator [Hoeflea sp. TYP-13]|uniref:TetR/AcrR family transcriptional regulator n=1 Tax=Hoeflea sp. TYP-13 TaxID=3230023 RepID=UPI0034C6457B
MSQHKINLSEIKSSSVEVPDGRRRRGVRSRQQITNAVLRLVRGGNFMPRTHEIANASGLSLRTVFRHIDDMESLYREMSAQIEAEVMPVLLRPYESSEWRGQLMETLSKRAEIYEHILPMKVAASLRRFRSEFLMENYRRFLAIERSQLTAILPEPICQDNTLFDAIDLAANFETWRRLRYDRELDVSETEKTVRFVVEKLISDL